MEGTPELSTGLATLVHALNGRKAALLDELRRVEQDLEATKRTLEAAERLGFGSVVPSSHRVEPATPASPVSATRTAPAAVAVPPRPVTPPPSSTVRDVPTVEDAFRAPGHHIPPSSIGDFELHSAALASMGPVRDDKAIPPRAEDGRRLDARDLPNTGAGLAAIKESLRGIVSRAAKKPLAPGERHYKPVGQLVPGEAGTVAAQAAPVGRPAPDLARACRRLHGAARGATRGRRTHRTSTECRPCLLRKQGGETPAASTRREAESSRRPG